MPVAALLQSEEKQSRSLDERLLHGTFWCLAGNLFAQALGFVSSVVTARLLGREAYGQLNIVTGMIGTLGTFAGLGLGMTATKYIAELKSSDKDAAGRIASALLKVGWWSGAAFTVGLYLTAKWVAREVLLSPSMTLPLIIGAPLVALNTLGGLQTSLLQGLEKFRTSAVVNVLRSAVVTFAVIWACLGWGLNGVIGTTVAATAFTILFYVRLLRKECAGLGIHIGHGRVWDQRMILFHYSFPALLASVVVGPANWAASAIVARHPGGYAELGMLAAANQWRQGALLIPQLLTGVLMPLLSSEGKNGKTNDTFSYLLEKSQWIATLIVFPIASVAMFSSSWLVKLYGRAYAGAGDLIVITCGTAMVIAIGMAFGAAIQARAMMWLGLVINVSYGLILVSATGAFAGRYGGQALAWATFAAYVATSLWSFAAMRTLFSNQMGRRLYFALGYSVALTFACYCTPAVYRIRLTPAAGLASLLVISLILIPHQTKNELRAKLRCYGLR